MKRHELDVLSLVFAILFIALGAIFLTGDVHVGEFIRVWALPMSLVTGSFILGAIAVSSHRRQNKEDDQSIGF